MIRMDQRGAGTFFFKIIPLGVRHKANIIIFENNICYETCETGTYKQVLQVLSVQSMLKGSKH
jgi:hypothetical protein